MNNILLVACGGAIGASLRYLIANLCTLWFGIGFPFGTLAVNVIGSFLMGIIAALVQTGNVNPDVRLFVAVGMLGAFTTFSTFSNESMQLMQSGQYFHAAVNIILNLSLCLMGIFIGQWLVLSKV